MPPKRSPSILFPVLLLIAWGVLIYANSFQVPFQFDDYLKIVKQPAITDVTDLGRIWSDAYGRPTRFVTYLTFALNFHFHKLDVFGYHLVNTAVHITNTLLLLWLVLLITSSRPLKDSALARHKVILAFGAALIFLTHPVQTQAVTYISQRLASLATLFYLLAVCLYAKARQETEGSRRALYFSLCAAATLTGMFAKEITFTIPLAVVMTEYFFFRDPQTATDKKPRPLFWAVIGLFLLIIPAVLFIHYRNFLTATFPSGSHDGDVINSWNYFLTQFCVITHYIRLWAYPYPQLLDYDFPVSNSFFEPATLMCFLFLTALLAAGIIFYRRHRIVSFGIFWFFLTLSVESSIVPIAHVIFEHRVYLPSVGLSIVTAYILMNVFRKPRIALTCIVGICLVFSYLTFQRNRVWQSPLKLWQESLHHSPAKARPNINVGVELLHRGKIGEALKYLNKALSLDPDNPYAYESRAAIYAQIGREELAEKDFDRALELDPSRLDALVNKGNLFSRQGKFKQAIATYNEALKRKPDFAPAHLARGQAHLALGQIDQALEDLTKAIHHAPGMAQPYLDRADIYRQSRQYKKALRDNSTAVRLAPDSYLAHNDLATSYYYLKDYERAFNHYSTSLQLNPEFGPPYVNRALISLAFGSFQRAIDDATAAINLKSSLPKALTIRGRAYLFSGEVDRAVQDFNHAIGIAPDNGQAYYFRSKAKKEQGNIVQAIEDAEKSRQLGYPVEEQYLKSLHNQ